MNFEMALSLMVGKESASEWVKYHSLIRGYSAAI